jgi:hypothetical protein
MFFNKKRTVVIKQLYKKLSAWMILVGLFLQISTPVAAALKSSHSMSSNTVISGKSGVSVKNHLSELQDTESVDVANFNVHGLIEQIVEDAVEQGYENNLSSALMRCYKSVSEGETVLDADILIEAIPELLQYAIEQEKIRASRPDAPTSNANNAIVACGGDCDLTQLIRLLASIRARIGTVNDSPCCGTILGILGDACNVPCIGENGSISEVLCEILDCCTQITGSSAINIDLSGVYTAIADLKTTLTECCAEIHVEFNGVFTVLAGLDFDCSTTVEIDLNGVFTVLASLDLNCSTTVEIDLNGVFTTLANLDLNCSTTVDIDLSGVFTVLANLDLNCSTTVEIDLNGVFTTLANLDLNCSTTVDIDLNGVFTAIADVKDTLTECCDEIKSDIFDTQTLIIDGFEQTWTILAGLDLNCSTTVEIDLNGVFTVLADIKDTLTECCAETKADFEGTWTILADIENKLDFFSTFTFIVTGTFILTVTVDFTDVINTITDCCAEIKQDFEGTWTMIEDCCACEPVPLFQSDVDPVTNAILLTVSGVSYCLAENITGTISITGDNVTIEGNNRLVTGRIFINASEVIIKDTNVQAPGVADVSEMSFAGIHIAGGSDNQIVNCVVTCDAAPNSSLGATGRTGIFSAGIRTRILDSDAVGGNGGAATNVGSSGGNGGIGIQINATDGLINTSRGLGGVGGGALGGTGINTGGNGGIGILLSGDHGIIKDSEGKGGNGGGAFSDPGGAGGVGGSGIRMTGVIGAIENSVGIGGDGGVGVTGGTVGGAGGIGIDINGDKYAIRSSQAIGGSGVQGFGGGSGGIGLKILGSNALINNATITGGDAGLGNAATNGGGGGAGIELPVGANFVDIFNSIVTGGNGGNAGGNGGDAGSGMNINIPNVRVADSEIRGGSGGNGNTGGSAAVGIDVLGGASNVTIGGSTLIGGNGGTGSIAAGGGNGHAIAIQGSDVIVADSKLFAGNGASGATNGGNGGSGIVILGNNITVNNLVINAGNGGSGSTNGGNGGNGINIGVSSSDIKTIIIRACTIMDGGVGGTGGTPGNGGHGIFVSSSLSFIVSDIQISDCTINNFGQATAPGIGGDGIRIDSADTDNPSTCIQVINTQIIGSAGNGLYIIAGSNIEVKECSATCNGIDGFVIDNGGGIIFDSLNSLHNLSAGIHTGVNSFDIQIKDCKAEANGTDGILVEAAATQVISCCATSNTLFGINNLGGTVATYYNNVATNNLGGNYSGVSLVRVPGPQTGFYTNVAQGQQDCDLCDLFTVVADISDTQTLLMAGFEGTWTILGDCCACGPIPLFQSDVVGGAITLSTAGMNYCLAENITGTILVTGGNITIEGNDRVLTGRIRIDAADPIVKNIKVKPAAPANNIEAAFAAIDITSNGSNAQILNCLIVCANSTVSGVVGRSGIITAATKTWVKDCNITAGAAATVTAGAATTAVGGSGIVISGSFGLISDSLAIAGAGSTNDVVASLGGAGGIGVQISGANGLILNSKFIGGNGGAAGPNPDPGNSTGGAGGRGGDVTGADIQVVDSEFTGGSGGVIPSGAGTTTGGIGGVGFSMASLNGQFLNSNATGGLGGNSASNTSTGGAGGAAFGIGTDNVEVRNSTLIGVSGGTGVTGGAGGQGVGIGANNIMMADTKLIAGSGANGTATGGGSGFGITAQSCNRITFLNLTVIGGNGGVGGTGLGGTALSSIDILGCNVVLVKACNIIDGSNGGNGGTTGGNGGSGILVRAGSVDVQISECRVERVGAAGTGGAPTPGNGIDISSATNVQVTSNYVSGCPGNGIRTAGGTNHQVMSNRVSACTLFAFLNSVGTQAVFGNNAATNTGANYSGVTVRTPVSLDAAPATPPTYWDNIYYSLA